MATSNPYPQWSKQWIIADKIGVEGAYTNNAADAGGATKYGVTQRTANIYKADLQKLFNWSGDIKDFTIDMAFYVYDKEFWQHMSLDGMMQRSPAIADKMFDIGINSGWPTANQWFQTILNGLNNGGQFYKDLVVDGNVGPASLAALDSLMKARGAKTAAWTVMKGLLCMQGAAYINIGMKNTSQEAFVQGWLNRLDHNLVDYYKALQAS